MSRMFIVNNSTEVSEITAFANDPAVSLDVTSFDLSRLPEHVKASLCTSAMSFSAPQLQTSGDIAATSATSFSAPELRTSGYIHRAPSSQPARPAPGPVLPAADNRAP